MIDVKRLTYILGLVLATIYEGVVERQLGNVSQRAGDGDAARFGQTLDPLATYTLSPNMLWFSSSTITSARCTPIRNINLCSSSRSSLNRAMLS